ncbi:tumor necrosis factor alpha-induced protein 8-like protein [Diaphorina citri]|uniref:Tumor necrosis factor alpha-induced protein 8-like protein n=1 Tax=Diaphorina citri TaxID=121845 RepID=A0A3Q0IRE1_DIACI|nr:tumor necrosis factor alpha-induced protein 8-like protein [Diaphorina citri]
MSSSPDTDRFKTNDLAMRVQKKLASKMSNKSMVKMYIDDRSGRLLDNLYRVIKTYTNNKKQSEKIIKTLIKIIIKTTLLVKNHQFSSTELTTCETLKAKFHTLLMSLISFYEVDFSYDAAYLIRQLTTLRSQLAGLLQRHLTSKNLTNLDNLFYYHFYYYERITFYFCASHCGPETDHTCYCCERDLASVGKVCKKKKITL